ncbi:MAG: 4-hydroxy-tetrahydrodipicolinate reductase [Candidatus Azotimanducaceae bacterium]
MLRIGISGVAGKMGRALVQAIFEAKDLSLGAAFESASSPVIGIDAGELAGVGKLDVIVEELTEGSLNEVDIVIDFSIPVATLSLAEICEIGLKGMVIGTTGFEKDQLSYLEKCSANIPIFMSPNMSVGVNVLFKLARIASESFGEEVDCEILEAHHAQKIDAPSGTAVRLGEILANSRSADIKNVGTYGREGLVGERMKQEIGFSSIRGGDIVGDHTVFFIGEGERIEITHRAQSRVNFAQGAIRAARFLSDKKTGLYDMEKLLDLS